ncbi:MAG: divalent-cation tolerance protein CutA [bacterium]
MQLRARHKSKQLTLVYTTVERKSDAEKIARQIIQERFSACINIIPGITSFYVWKGKIIRAKEYLLVIKTRKALVNALEKRIRSLHPYELPEFIAIDITKGSTDYIKWFYENTEQERRSK